MALPLINLGTAAESKDGDPLRIAYGKANAYFQDHENRIAALAAQFSSLGVPAFASFGTVSGTIADGGALTAETTRATAAEQSNATGISNLSTALNAKAPLASPALTGTPTAPTAPNGTSTTQIATTAFVIANAVTGGGGSAYSVNYTAQTLTGAQQLQARQNITAAASGANGDITSLTGLTTPLSIAQGGTGATAASGARTLLGAAASGANTDITSLGGITTALSIAQGGTGATSAAAALTGLGAAPLASPAFTGTPTVPTATAGTSTTQAASTAFVSNAVASGAAPPATAVRLNYTNATTLTLVPVDGIQLYVAGANRTLPSAGVTLANTSAAASSAYYIYAAWSGSAVTLLYSTTAPAADATTGLKFMTGDATKTLVGGAITNASSQWQAAPLTSSYFNRRDQVGGTASTAVTITTGTNSEIGTSLRAFAWVWADEALDVTVSGWFTTNSGGVGAFSSIYAATDTGVFSAEQRAGGAGNSNQILSANARVMTKPSADGQHYGTAYGYISPGGSFTASYTLTTIVKTRG